LQNSLRLYSTNPFRDILYRGLMLRPKFISVIRLQSLSKRCGVSKLFHYCFSELFYHSLGYWFVEVNRMKAWRRTEANCPVLSIFKQPLPLKIEFEATSG
jgi:hypothetical protein